MSTITQGPVMLYTEQTPNPESLKFVTNRMLYPNNTADFREEGMAKEWSPLATALFEFPFVKGVYIANNFVTITKEFNYSWEDTMLNLKEFIKNYIQDGKEILKEGFGEVKKEMEAKAIEENGDENPELSKKIRELIDTYVKPAVEMDGGNIEFKSFKEGKVHVVMQGSCSGCPSSSVTLKAGIEGMLKRMVPEVQEVVAEAG